MYRVPGCCYWAFGSSFLRILPLFYGVRCLVCGFWWLQCLPSVMDIMSCMERIPGVDGVVIRLSVIFIDGWGYGLLTNMLTQDMSLHSGLE